MTIDNLLVKIVNFSSPTIEEKIHPRDSRVLRSLANSITSHLFITENQSKLLIKILRENSEKLSDFTDEIKTKLADPTWSHTFRQIDQIKKLYIGKHLEGELFLFIEAT